MEQQQWLISFVNLHPILVYGFIALFSCVEGPVLAMLGGILFRLGYMPLIPLYVSLMVGDLIGDTAWYFIGRHFGTRFLRRFGKYFNINEKEINSVQRIFHRYKNHILIISKITMGFGFAIVTLFTAGLVKIPFRRYITLNAIGQFVWTAFLLALGYVFGNLYVSINGIFGKVSLIAVLIIAFIALVRYGKYIKDRMSKSAEVA